MDSITFREEASVARLGVLAQIPAIAKVVVALDQLYAVAAGETELVGAAGLEFVCARTSVCGSCAVLGPNAHHDCGVLRQGVVGRAVRATMLILTLLFNL